MKEIFKVIASAILVVGLVIGYGWIIAWAWNITIPVFFGLPMINFGQVIAFTILFAFITSFFKKDN